MPLSAVGLQTHIWNNNIKSTLLLLGYPILLLVLLWAGCAAYALFSTPVSSNAPSAIELGFAGVAKSWHYVLIFTAIWFAIAWKFHQSFINKSTGARPLTRRENPYIYNLLENLCISRGLIMPKLYIIDTPALNAYASGLSEKSYAITLTAGIILTLDEAELESVLAHELTHIINRDVRLLVIGVIFAGMITFFAEMARNSLLRTGHYGFSRRGRSNTLLIMIIASVILAIGAFLALVIRMAISRKREYLADAGAVELTKNPDAMVSALRKISGRAEMEDAPPEIQQMFIENPPSAYGIFDTHPSIEARIWALKNYAGAQEITLATPRKNPWQRAPRKGPWDRR
ncbi:MAG: M48 family metallopeptidase [Alphaproteobacteria bacterium]|nr:M48 family metallopeptidase [Alphaproteobacteria bacterium]